MVFAGQLFRKLRRSFTSINCNELNFRFSNSYYRKLHFYASKFDLNILDNDRLMEQIKSNIVKRHSPVNIDKLQDLHSNLKSLSSESNCADEKQNLKNKLLEGISMFPNDTHPDVLFLKDNKVIETIGTRPTFDYKPLELHDISRNLDSLINNFNIKILMGRQSYYLTNCLAELEQALISFTIDRLINEYGFHLVSVPNLLNRNIIEACGLNTHGERNQVFKVKKDKGEADVCLSGTAEMALAAMYMDEVIDENSLPQKLVSVSRCCRAELSGKKEEKGIYRVPEFTKVEMFSITKGETTDDSNNMLEHFYQIQKKISEDLGLHFKILDMCPLELGNPAYRKYDIEAWMPGRKMFGEISSASNCTDYQSKRLGIQYRNNEGDLVHAHTVNGTACAIPRMLISLVETFQQKNGQIIVPPILRNYVKKDFFTPPKEMFKFVRMKS